MDRARPQKEHSFQFLAHVYCHQTAGCISIPLGTEAGLGPDDIVLDGDPASPKVARPPNFRPMSTVAKWSPILSTAELLLIGILLLYLHVMIRTKHILLVVLTLKVDVVMLPSRQLVMQILRALKPKLLWS